MDVINYSKFRFRIGDEIIMYDKDIVGEIVAYYFSSEFNKFDIYGYTIKIENGLHDGGDFSYDELGNELIFEDNSCVFVEESSVKCRLHFTRNDLRPGMIVISENDEPYIVVDMLNIYGLMNRYGFIRLSEYDNNLQADQYPNIKSVYKLDFTMGFDAIFNTIQSGTIKWKLIANMSDVSVQLTMQQIADKFGVNPEQIKITDYDN